MLLAATLSDSFVTEVCVHMFMTIYGIYTYNIIYIYIYIYIYIHNVGGCGCVVEGRVHTFAYNGPIPKIDLWNLVINVCLNSVNNSVLEVDLGSYMLWLLSNCCCATIIATTEFTIH